MSAPMSTFLRTNFGRRLHCYVRFLKTSSDATERRDFGRDFNKNEGREKKNYRMIQPDKKSFRTLELKPPKEKRTYDEKHEVIHEPGREARMKTDQDWTSVWPTAQSFRWSAVPVPLRQGFIKSKSEGPGDGTPPTKHANMELMKIPNFLHLTPKHIAKQCKTLKKFCTPWPKQLDKQSQIRHHFPLEVIASDYCFSAPSIRDPRSRGVSITLIYRRYTEDSADPDEMAHYKPSHLDIHCLHLWLPVIGLTLILLQTIISRRQLFRLTDLKLDKHSKDKFIRLVGPRYNQRSGSVIIMSDRCPIKKQNYDYCMYLLTALYFESWKVEPWESEKTLEDMEEYVWEINPSKAKVVHILQQCQQEDQENPDVGDSKLLYLADKPVSGETVLELEPVKKYKEAVEDLVNSGETTQTLEDYKQSVLQMLHKNTAAPPP